MARICNSKSVANTANSSLSAGKTAGAQWNNCDSKWVGWSLCTRQPESNYICVITIRRAFIMNTMLAYGTVRRVSLSLSLAQSFIHRRWWCISLTISPVCATAGAEHNSYIVVAARAVIGPHSYVNNSSPCTHRSHPAIHPSTVPFDSCCALYLNYFSGASFAGGII